MGLFAWIEMNQSYVLPPGWRLGVDSLLCGMWCIHRWAGLKNYLHHYLENS